MRHARQALALAGLTAKTRYSREMDFVDAHRLVGWGLTEVAGHEPERRGELLTEAELHLTEALTRCRRINMVDREPDVLLAWARWQRAMGDSEQARKDVEEALAIADRCEYRLVQTGAHNLLADLALDAGDFDEARQHAEIAKERAWCDGPPHCYKPALDRAEELLARIEAEAE